ncbi:unnamed protein product [Peronospora belbahrii]|uniref:Uncharacterized protein n=1 Tax=Peronospora belbahrii TaxID=622444 RepID=A0AAU9L2W4_9STRA|nr:unnamed protein product [Peronospora belbahrii]CAH0481252.1 unnamed protein product [Peronospora belbahrii]CAH0521685.1 unnamed protein product [Peronospora belbahrii]
MTTKAYGFVLQPQTHSPRPTQIQPQHHDNESDATATDFLDELVAAVWKDYPTDDLYKFKRLLDVLLAHSYASNESMHHSNWSSTIDPIEVPFGSASEEEETFHDVENGLTPLPKLISTDADTDASIAFDNETGSSSEGLESAVGDDANMRVGKNVYNSAAVRLLSGMIVSIITVHTFTLSLSMLN